MAKPKKPAPAKKPAKAVAVPKPAPAKKASPPPPPTAAKTRPAGGKPALTQDDLKRRILARKTSCPAPAKRI